MRYFIYACKNTFNYRDRARRAEFGWFMLISTLLSWGIHLGGLLLLGVLFKLVPSLRTGDELEVNGYVVVAVAYIIYALYSLIIFLATLSVTARRLHDLGWSGWWQLVVYVVPVVTLFILFFTMPFLEDHIWQTPSLIALSTVILLLVPVIFWLILLFKDGQKRANKYGESPKYPTMVAQAENEVSSNTPTSGEM